MRNLNYLFIMSLRYYALIFAAFICATRAQSQSYGFVSANMTDVRNTSSITTSFISDKNGDLLLSGTFSDTMDTDPGPAFVPLAPSASNDDVFIQKQSRAGSLIWHYALGSGGTERVFSISLDSQNNIYVLGSFESTVDFDAGPGLAQLTATTGNSAGFLLKLSPQGQFRWVRKFGENSYPIDVTLDRKGSIYMCGAFDGTADFDPGAATFNMTSPNRRSLFVQKMDTAGNFKWAKAFNNNTLNGLGQSSVNLHVTADSAGNPAICGQFYETVDFDPGPGTANMTAGVGLTGYQMFVAKLDSLGNYRWAKRYSKVFARDLVTDHANNMIMTGQYESANDFDPGTGVATLSALGGLGDIFVLKIDTGGNYLWANPLTSSDMDGAGSIRVDEANNIYLVGTSGLSVANPLDMDFDPGPGTLKLPYIAANTVSFLYSVTAQGAFRSLTYLPTTQSSYTSVAVTDSNNLHVLAIVGDSLDVNHGTGVYKVYERWRPGVAYSVIRLAACSGATSFTTVADTACASYRSASGRYTWTTSGSFKDTIANAYGCDSVLTYNLVIYPRAFDTIAVSACGSYVSPSARYTWTASGRFQDTLRTVLGCDSVLTVDLTINNNTFWTISPYACERYTSPSGRYSWAATGIYRDTIPNAGGCDSILTINLTIHDTSVIAVPGGLAANSNDGSFQWLDCGNGYAPVSGATSEFFYPARSGSYAVVVSHNGCTDTSGCHEFRALGLPGAGAGAGVSVSPNPAGEVLHVTFPGTEELVDLELVTVNGSRVWSGRYRHQSGAAIDVRDLSPGVYFLKLRAASWSRTLKVVRR